VPAGADTLLDTPEEDLVGRPVGRELMGVRVTAGLLLEATGEEEPAGTEELTAGVETTEEEGATEGATEGMELEATEGAEEDCTVDDSSGADTAEEEEAVGAGSAAVGTTRTVEVEASAPGVTERARTRRAWRPS
jgi:hypothetical protein